MATLYNGEDIPWSLLAKDVQNCLAKEEEEALAEWLAASKEHQALQAELGRIWSLPEADLPPSSQAEVWLQLQQKLQQRRPKKTFWQRYTNLTAVAASLLLVVFVLYGTGSFNWKSEAVAELNWLELEAQDSRNLQMPDGSIIFLNKKSKLRYPDRFQDRREVELLAGEAFFEINRDLEHPFVLQIAKAGQLEVLGTSFNVRAYENESEMCLSVSTGKVRYRSPEGEEYVLEKGEAVYYNYKDKRAKLKSPVNPTYWRDGLLNYKDFALADLRQDVEQKYGVHLEFEDEALGQCLFNGSFKSPKVEEVLQAVSFTLNLSVKKVADKTYLLSGAACTSALD
ncbi:Fe2+-dicitrate sensor, membrane component [Saprospira grandis DSM 2844]|uniref:Fe2+-dicitrate sensor, membrane component n=1 Tax=Saprospira grandis DSM 2844 TaxID=694433 RepID=J0XVA6_9BACT|nr:FecR domain-containing protein [Saprospira grandis]EJF52931.1 Fe2+-dicitrate sensor, membrane component [Saprospira grandis DSM 2844]